MDNIPNEEMGREELVAALKEKLYQEIKEEQKHLVCSMTLFSKHSIPVLEESKILPDNLRSHFRHLALRAYTLDLFTDYVNEERSFSKYTEGSYQIKPSGNRTVVSRAKLYFVTDDILKSCLDAGFHPVLAFLDFCENRQESGHTVTADDSLFAEAVRWKQKELEKSIKEETSDELIYQ